ncbi:hypothetical protein BGZ46_005831, partial [Entomortierella lignicola]
TDTEEKVKAKKRKKWKPKAIGTNPHELVKAMTRAHQAATLAVGALKANTKQLELKSAQKRAILKCIKDHVQVDNLIKRRAQVALAMYISKEGKNGFENIRQAIFGSAFKWQYGR